MQEKVGYKRKTIKNHLRTKIEDFLDSIDDEDLKRQMAKSIIVTGGCIPSMLMGDQPNDYDIYFKSLGTVENVAKYYVDILRSKRIWEPEIKVEDIVNIRGVTEKVVHIYIKSAGVEELESDRSEEELVLFENQELNETGEKYRIKFVSQTAISLSDKIQLILRFYGLPSDIHKNFDFVHCTCYYDYFNNELVLPPEALEAILSKTLVYKGSLYPVASIFRMRKFIKRGWRINVGQILKILYQISKIDLSNIDTLKWQLVGVDVSYMRAMISALENVKMDYVEEEYLGEVIERIFGE